MTAPAETHLGAGAALGARVCAIAGLAWTAWGSGVLPARYGAPLVLVALLAAVAVGRRLRQSPAAPAPEGRGHGMGRGYGLIVAGEVVAILVGIAALHALTGSADGNAGWIAFVLGVHFFALARVWPGAGLPVLGVLVTAAGLAGLAATGLDAGPTVSTALPALGTGLVLLSSAGAAAARA